ncbi:MAG: RsmB/NOP family class I SAM-dependent RNA methyltransferase [Pseudomonadota bacterium]
MTPAARLSAAIEVLAEIFNRYQPPALALKEWGRAHRFAGSGDRAIIGNLVYDVLRRKNALAWLMGSDAPRALVLALHARFWAAAEDTIRLCNGENHSPAALSTEEASGLSRSFDDAPLHVKSFLPEWLISRLLAVYSTEQDLINQGLALAERAPVDLRVNALKAVRDKILPQLERFKPSPMPHSPFGIRIAYGSREARSPHVEVEGAYQRGHIELQDEASQLASLLTGAAPGEQVADLCAGGGGKTLALAALMQNKGQIIASDNDRHRLAPIYERLQRAGAHNVQVTPPDKMDGLDMKMDRVVLDVPCTGAGAWRRRPDNKWRLSQKNINDRIAEQDAILQTGAELVRRGGELCYITCSILREENEDRIESFLKTENGQAFSKVDMRKRWSDLLGTAPPPQPAGVENLATGLRFSPASSGTDGFFISCLQKHG